MDGLRISELAERVAVSTSTVRYYERIGVVPAPQRSASGYRLYGADAAARLLFITRGKRLGLSLDEIADLLAIWDGTNCGPTQERLSALLAAKQVEIREQIQELERFTDQLADVEARLLVAPVVDGCAPDLACCAPELPGTPVAVSLSGGRSGGTGSAANEATPIACTMTSVERPARTAEFEALADHVIGWTRGEKSVRLRFPPRSDIEAQLRDLIGREQECCAFLSFTLQRLGNEWCWDIEAPDVQTAPALDEFLPLLSPARESRAVMTEPRVTLPSRPPQRRPLGAVALAAACILACTLSALVGLASGAVLKLFDAPVSLVILAAGAVAGVVAGVRRRRGGRPDGCC